MEEANQVITFIKKKTIFFLNFFCICCLILMIAVINIAGHVPVWIPVHKQRVLCGHAPGLRRPQRRGALVGRQAGAGHLPRAGHGQRQARGPGHQAGPP